MEKSKSIVNGYKGIGKFNSENASIQKAKALQCLAETDLTLPELKILDTYLARINSHDASKRTVVFEKGELENILGVQKILKQDLQKRLRHLFQVIEIKDENKENGINLIGLFEQAQAEKDKRGLWQITLTCTQAAREYIFNIDNIGYLRYRLQSIVALTSRYSYTMFLYLIDNRFRKQWEIDIDELRKTLCCTAVRYNQFKFFNAEVLKKCYDEINNKTDIKYEYKPIRIGKSIGAIEITIITVAKELNKIEEKEETEETEETESNYKENCGKKQKSYDEPDIEKYGSELLAMLALSTNEEFSPIEMEEIFSILLRTNIPEDKYGGIEWGRITYLREKYNLLNIAAERAAMRKKPIKNRFAYFKKMLEQDASVPLTLP